ncbi:hypothetical protein H113_08031 [Trichophyton rubrum MR1459]|uniref:Uncharacterized protein n=1 Tax=Trichophyton rubrum (strain ATCC MYA-4607 / CBS 118892) TaxID=559305 RepID=A0A080WDV6_TRIRC|nr:uncharacterized protein TERG_11587 [Trichophyton rubrum CBS 118892]EZF90851.1 hypothetical protein H113_08031 [Trichophyton rubrum MR1459]EZG01768.1 hypothetical protein H106_07838 [Trichophyton rubrum CBS 735.88]KFL60271.1 hypothetical protein TERG_11587 [Trichophyton rubrum CBS 118892]
MLRKETVRRPRPRSWYSSADLSFTLSVTANSSPTFRSGLLPSTVLGRRIVLGKLGIVEFPVGTCSMPLMITVADSLNAMPPGGPSSLIFPSLFALDAAVWLFCPSLLSALVSGCSPSGK